MPPFDQEAIMEIATLLLALLAFLCSLASLLRRREGLTGEDLEQVRQDLLAEVRSARQELNTAFSQNLAAASQQQILAQKQSGEVQDRHLQEASQQLGRLLSGQLGQMNEQLHSGAVQNEQKLENLRQTIERRLAALQQENDRQLSEMRRTVDDTLQKTLEDKLNNSFRQVTEQLESVYKGLGEMQSLAAGVGDLKKVLSNVKTRGILGETQLKAILEQLLTPEQYAENVATRPRSSERVEFALRLPGDGQTPVWLPIDAKFPSDSYAALMDACDQGDPAAVETAARELERRVRSFAKDIHDKYIEPPFTTDFGVMFLPVEGLYAEVVRRGIAEKIQREFRIVVTGPTTMSALLNSLQMGFRTLAIQKRSSEVWAVLGSVRSEFQNFTAALAQTQNRITQAGDELEKLVGVRSRQMQRRLDAVTRLAPDLSAGDSSLPQPRDPSSL